jgi:hypothetical protein|tara:strand:- start:781 stop:921 length:141 start_codon:yes stop_codon:yes gene_type:complete
MKNLTTQQQEQIERLIRLGDSKELATETVLNIKNNDSDIYQTAYYS